MRPVIRRDFNRLIVEFDFDSAFIDALKTVIPENFRNYEGGKVWSVAPMYYSALVAIAAEFWGSTVIDATGGVSEPQTHGWRERWDVWKTNGRAKHEAAEKAKRAREKAQESAKFNWTEYDRDIFERAQRAREGSAGGQRRTRPTSTSAIAAAFATLFVTQDAPASVIKAAYRVLASDNHPDKGGNPESMARINAAYQELKKLGRVD